MNTTILILLVSCAAAFARLGESNIEIKARYGPVLKRVELSTNTWMGAYAFKEYTVGVIFKDNVSVWESVAPAEQRKFTNAEAEALMASIAGKGKWTKDPSSDFMKTLWINTEMRAKADMVDKIGGRSRLTIMSIEFINDAEAKRVEDDKKKADGF